MKKHIDTITVALVAGVFSTFIWWAYLEWGGVLLRLRELLILVGTGSVFTLPLVLWRLKKVKLAIYGAMVVSLLVLAAFPWTPRIPFLQHLLRVRPGMTLAQVDAVMKPYWRASPPRPYPDHLGDTAVYYRHSNEAGFNSDFGEVLFRKGRAIRTRFMAD